MPGWGGWVGGGIEWKPPPKDLEKIKKKEKLQEEARQNRTDANLSHVIINQKEIKPLDKYKFRDVPLAWKSKEALEKSLSLPLGKEFNTLKTHSQLVQPKIVSTPGLVISPIHRKVN